MFGFQVKFHHAIHENKSFVGSLRQAYLQDTGASAASRQENAAPAVFRKEK
jgi:hypothetical protein